MGPPMHMNWRYKTAGYAGWLAIAAPTFADIWSGQLVGVRAAVWACAFIVFGAVYLVYLRPQHPFQRRLVALGSIATLTVAGLTMVIVSVGLMKYLASITLTIVAGELPYLLPRRIVWVWIALQSLALATVFWLSFGWVSGLAGGCAYAGFQVFALGKAWLEIRERMARRELARANAELNATRALLAERTRITERLRIARDLHDSLGHHLTALSLQLDVASRKLDGPAATHVDEALAIARLLLSDVRTVVGELRDRSPIDLAAAIESLATFDSLPRVHVRVSEVLSLDTPEQANALLRSAQEVVTNAIRHAHAQNIWLEVSSTDRGIQLDARDDGGGATALTLGHGLSGIRERFEEHDGTVEFSTASGQGFAVHAFMPRREPAS